MGSAHVDKEGDISKPVDKEDSSPSSSSSSDSSLEEFFHVDPKDLPKDDEKAVSGDRSSKAGESSDQRSPSNANPKESTLDSSSPKQSPQIQTMGRSAEPDPYRIPSSVFARNKSTTPVEWSVASNESLFSIHVGNTSFSKDLVVLMGKSGELGPSGELINFPDFPLTRPPDKLVKDEDRKTSCLRDDAEGGQLGVAEAAAETVKEVMRAAAEDHNNPKKSPADANRLSSSPSHRSDGSGASIRSFAFPLLTAEGGRISDSMKVDSEQQSQKLPETPVPARAEKGGKWFSCFSCCPFCC